jgi:hypothetical protein
VSGYTGALTGHNYTRARPLGYEPWQPAPDSAAMLAACHRVLARLADANLVPIGPRAVAYKLEHQVIADREVLKDADLVRVPKAERGSYWSFDQIGGVLNRGRRAGMIRWGWVSDGGAAQDEPLTFADRDHVLEWLVDHVLPGQLIPDVLADQPVRVEVSCEAVDFMTLAGRITKPLGVGCYSARGWGGPDPARDAGHRWASDPRPLVVLSLGDLDPEGIGIVERNFEDAAQFAVAHGGARPVLQRIAVTADQVRDWRLSAGPAKTSHRHGLRLPVTCEVDAIPPERLRDLLVSSIEELLDTEVAAATRSRWETELEWLADAFGGLRNGNGATP